MIDRYNSDDYYEDEKKPEGNTLCTECGRWITGTYCTYCDQDD